MQEIWYSMIGDLTPATAAQFISWANGQAYANPVKKLKIFLSSEGGDVESALTIYHYIKALPFDVEIVAFNKVASAANIVFVSAERRYATADCVFVLHEGTNTINNQTASLHQHEDSLLWMKDRIGRHVGVLVYETGKSQAEIEKGMAETLFLNSDAAKEFGLLNGVIEKLPVEMVRQA